MNNQTVNIQYTGSLTTTVFTGVNFNITGDNSKLIVNAPLSLNTSTFTFNDGSYFNTSYNVDMVSSKVNLYDKSQMYSTGASSTLINLSSNSQIAVGNGSLTSTAMFTVSGPTLNVYDNSTVYIGNENNVYYNWSNYNGTPTTNSNSNATKSYSTSSNTMNCGGTHAHACAMPYLYGPSNLTIQGTVSGTTLPVVLVGFSATLNNNNTTSIEWSTKIEENVSRFDIERSADGSNWSVIGTVSAVGNTVNGANYSYIDPSPLSGVNYYRLKMVDLDAKYGYTAIKVVRSGSVSSISFFPNPARDFVNVSLGSGTSGQVTVRLFSQSGQLVQEKNVESATGAVVTFPLQNLSAGFYLISVISADGSRETSKLVVTK
jgi:hypothetical protein